MKQDISRRLLLSVDDLVDQYENVVRRSFWIVAAGVAALFVFAKVHEPLRMFGAGLIAVAGLLPAWLWCTRRAFGLPLVPAVAFYDVIWFATPILRGHVLVDAFSPTSIFAAAVAESGFLFALGGVWYAFCRRRVAPPPVIYTLGTRPRNLRRLIQLSLAVLAISTVHVVIVQSTDWKYVTRILPGELGSPVQGALRLGGVLACLLLSMAMASGMLTLVQRILFGIMVAIYLSGLALGLFLAPLVPIVSALFGGWTLATGRIPWKALVPVVLALNLMHVGKAGMREKYWNVWGREYLACYPWEYPAYYAEWLDYGLAELAGEREASAATGEDETSDMFDRMSLLQMLLLAQSMAPREVAFLGGESYSIGFGSIVPRVLWANKPSPHAGQALLNVHFRRQTISETQRTYIAWGAVAEAWANFGWWGIPVAGGFFGLILGYVSRKTISVPIASLRFALASVFATIGISATQIATTVWCSSLFQALCVVGAGTFMLVVKERNPLAEPKTLAPTPSEPPAVAIPPAPRTAP